MDHKLSWNELRKLTQEPAIWFAARAVSECFQISRNLAGLAPCAKDRLCAKHGWNRADLKGAAPAPANSPLVGTGHLGPPPSGCPLVGSCRSTNGASGRAPPPAVGHQRSVSCGGGPTADGYQADTTKPDYSRRLCSRKKERAALAWQSLIC